MKKLVFLVCILTLGIFSDSNGQSAKFKAIFLYNFALNIDWPGASDSEIVFTVLGDNEIKRELDAIAKIKKVGSNTIKVVSANSVKEIGDSQIIFVGSAKSSLMPMVDSFQKGKKVLLVGDNSGLCKQGAGITFVTVDGKLRFEINTASINDHGINITQKIIGLGIIVH